MSPEDLIEQLASWEEESGESLEFVPTLDGSMRPASPQLRAALAYLQQHNLEGTAQLLSVEEMLSVQASEAFRERHRQSRELAQRGLLADYEDSAISVLAFDPEHAVEYYLLWQEHRQEPLLVNRGGAGEMIFWDILNFIQRRSDQDPRLS